jgi:mannose-6-phosphate isomerase-like protein (cupin superfamily)
VSQDQVREPIEGDGYAVAGLDGLGEGYGFRKIRRELGVTAFGVNAIVIPPGYETGRHYHEKQEELYLVHRGRIEIEFGDGSSHVLGEGGMARVDASTVRQVKNIGDEDATYVVVGAKDGYVGRDGRLPEGETSRFGSDSGPPSREGSEGSRGA